MKNTKRILKEAQRLAKKANSWADLSNALFDPNDGLLVKEFPNTTDRAEFIKSKEYQQIQNLLGEVIDRFCLVDGATPRKSGKFMVRLPQSLHAALEREADREGVSLNQLVVTKLALQLRTLVASEAK